MTKWVYGEILHEIPGHLLTTPDGLGGGWREFSAATGISRQTLMRWHERRRMPAIVRMWIDAATGDLGGLHPDWAGFQIRQGKLYDDCEQSHLPADLRGRLMMAQRCGEAQRASSRARQDAEDATRLICYPTRPQGCRSPKPRTPRPQW